MQHLSSKLVSENSNSPKTDAIGKNTTNSQDAQSTKRLSLDLSVALHTRFKTACSATGLKMTGELHTLIEQRTKELEEEARITRS